MTQTVNKAEQQEVAIYEEESDQVGKLLILRVQFTREIRVKDSYASLHLSQPASSRT